MGIDTNLLSIPDFENIQLVRTGVLTLNGDTTGDNDATVTVNHNLGYIPIALAYLDQTSAGGGLRALPTWTGRTVGSGNVQFNTWMDVNVDSTSFTIDFYTGTATNWGTFYIRYYLMRQTGKV